MSKEKHKIVPACYLVLLRNNDQEVLLSQRFNTGYMDGMYSMVAGHVEEKEAPIAALVREAKEEAGIDVKPEHIEIGNVMYRVKPTDSRLDIFLVARKWTGEIQNKEPEKCTDISWFSVNNLPANTIPYVKHGIESCLKKNPYSEFFGE